MEQVLNSITNIMSNNLYIAPILVFIAGIITSIMPCSLSTIPLVISCLNAKEKRNTKITFFLALFFCLGMTITYTILAVTATFIGHMMSFIGPWWYVLLGILMMIMAMQVLEIFNFIPPVIDKRKEKQKGYLGAVISGILAGVFSSPCSSPVLIVILSFISNNANIAYSVLLLLLYSLGTSVIVVLTAIFFDTVKKVIVTKKYGIFSEILKYVLGVVILLLGFYMFYLGF